MALRILKSRNAMAPIKTGRDPASVPTSRPSRAREFFTAADLADRWSVSERHVRRMIDAGELVAHKFGRAVRISYANVLRYEADRTGVT